MANPTTFDAKLKEAVPLYEKLKNEWSRKPPNVGKTEEILNSLKVLIKNFLLISQFFVLPFRIYLLKVDFIHPIQVKIPMVYILHVCLNFIILNFIFFVFFSS